MGDEMRKAISQFLCRKERKGPVTMSDRKRAEQLRVNPPRTPLAGGLHSGSSSSQPQSSRFKIRIGNEILRSGSVQVDEDDEDEESDEEDVPIEDYEEEEPPRRPKYYEADVVTKRARTGRFVGHSESVSGSGSGVGKKGKRIDDSWILRGPCLGGPEDPSVIPSFGGHVAKDIWVNPNGARGVIVCYNRPRVGELMDMDLREEVRECVVNSGVGHLIACTFDHVNVNLISAFVERWQPDTNTFMMPFGEITITLHDVEELLGIPIVGKVCGPIVDVNGKAMEPLKEVCALLGMEERDLSQCIEGGNAKVYKNGGVLVEKLKEIIRGRDDEDSAKAYLTALVGSTLFLDKSSDRVRPHVFPLLSSLDDVGSYAWGAGSLAYLYRQLGMASRADAKGIAGFLPLLEAWIYQYFPCFRPGAAKPLQPGAPRIMAWRGGPKHVADYAALRSYRERIDGLTTDSVWWVHGALPQTMYPSSLFSGCIRFMEIVEPYQPDRCMRQFGYVQQIPRMMPKGDYCRPAEPKGYKVEIGWYADHPWMNMSHHRVNLDDESVPVSAPGDMTTEYWEWYQRVSHPYIYDTRERRQTMVMDDIHAGGQVGLALARKVRPMVSMRSASELSYYMSQHGGEMEELCERLERCGGGGRTGRGGARGRRSAGRRGIHEDEWSSATHTRDY